MSDETGTIVCDEEEIVEKRIVSGVAYSRDEAKISLMGLPDHPGVSFKIFSRLADANVNVDMIVQSRARTSETANMTFTIGKRDAARAMDIIRAAQGEIGFAHAEVDEDVAKVSVIGVGMRSHAGVAKTMFGALAEKGVNIRDQDQRPDRSRLYRTGCAGSACGLWARSDRIGNFGRYLSSLVSLASIVIS
jgi:aspartate kinase